MQRNKHYTTIEVCEILNCTRQYVHELTSGTKYRKAKLDHAVVWDKGKKLYLKSVIDEYKKALEQKSL